MEILRKVSDLEQYVNKAREAGNSIGLVPTMGALHAGHKSLIDRAVRENDVALVSVFVNPTQFNNPQDLATYPRCESEDFALLESSGVSAVFAPSVEEIYGEGESPANFDLGSVAEVMEGRYRPGHFQGVCQIVKKLFDMSRPDRAYFGEKDYQQIAVIRRMVETEGVGVEIVACPICRAEDGLALSSRNALLSESQRKTAPGIYSTLKYSVEYSRNHSVLATKATVEEAIDALPECRVEYFEIVDGRTLESVEEWEEGREIVGCITVYCGSVRLIDNIRYR